MLEQKRPAPCIPRSSTRWKSTIPERSQNTRYTPSYKAHFPYQSRWHPHLHLLQRQWIRSGPPEGPSFSSFWLSPQLAPSLLLPVPDRRRAYRAELRQVCRTFLPFSSGGTLSGTLPGLPYQNYGIGDPLCLFLSDGR